MYKFSDVLKELIDDSGKSLRTISKETGIPNSQISRYIRNTIPKYETSMRLAKYFNCDLDYMFGLTENKGKYLDKYDIRNFLKNYLIILESNKTTNWKFTRQFNISESNIRKWKNGQYPHMSTVVNIAKQLGVSIEILLAKK